MNALDYTNDTELEAVNEILAGIGEAPVDSLANMTDSDAISAHNILKTLDRREQSRGWSFNKIKRYTLKPDQTGQIPFSPNYLYWRALDPSVRLVRSGAVFRDIVRNSTIFHYSIDAEVILRLPFDLLPEAYRAWIVAKASYEFNAKFFGDATTLKIQEQAVMQAWQILQEYEMDFNRFNVLDNPSVNRLVYRG